MTKDTVIIGDVHSCHQELCDLLDKINFDPSKIRLVFLGDIIHRGNKQAETVQLVRKLCENGEAECLMGNHENQSIRFHQHEKIKAATGKKNPMNNSSEKRMKEHLLLSDDDIEWMRKLPLKIYLKDNWYAIHGGLEPRFSFGEQRPEQIIRCRYVSAEGKAVPLMKDRSQPPNTNYWADVWNGKESIVFGHNVFDEPYVRKNENNTCVGVDTGAVYGNKLTAYFLEQNKFVSVNARAAYAER